MSDTNRGRVRLSASALVPAILVAVGIGLWMAAGKVWILLAGAGAFGPGLLRQMGLLPDLDEFQRQAVATAGYRAYLIGGSIACATIAGLHATGAGVRYPAELLTFLLVVLWLTWLFAYVMQVWGPKRTAATVLATFGSFWLLFALLTAVSESNTVAEGLVGLLMGAAVVAPFFGCAWAAYRAPRATGWALLAFSAVALGLFVRPWLGGTSGQDWTTVLMTTTTLVVPLVAVGMGLVRWRPDDDLTPDE